MKIDYRTSSYDEIMTAIKEEQSKAEYAFNKVTQNSKKRQEKVDAVFQKHKDSGVPFVTVDSVEWTSKAGNTWNMYGFLLYCDDRRFYRTAAYSFLFGKGRAEDINYWYIDDTHITDSGSEEKDGKPTVIIVFPHLIDQYSKRMSRPEKGLDALHRFITVNRKHDGCFYQDWGDDTPRYATWNDEGVCLGVVREDTPDHRIIELRTFIYHDMLEANQIELFSGAKRRHEERLAEELDAGEEFSQIKNRQEQAVSDAIELFGTTDIPAKCLACLYDHEIAWIKTCWDMWEEVTGERPPLLGPKNESVCGWARGTAKDLTEYCEERRDPEWILYQALGRMYKEFKGADTPTTEAWTQEQIDRHKISFDTQERFRTLYEHQIKLQMNSTVRTELHSLLKRTGITTKFETEVRKLSFGNKDQYVMLAEPVYVISRIIPCCTDDKVAEKMKAANKEWMKVVVGNELEPRLKPFIEKYGQELTLNSILYLIDQDLWSSPVGDKALRTKSADSYKGLDAIYEAAVYLKDVETSQNPPAAQEAAIPEQKSETQSDAPGITFDLAAMKAARDKQAEIKATLRLVAKQVDELLTDSKDMELVDLLEEENKQLQGTITELQTKLKETEQFANSTLATNSTLMQKNKKLEQGMTDIEEKHQKSLGVLKKELERERAALKTAKEDLYNFRVGNERLTERNNKLTEEFEELQKAHNILKEAAKASPLPTKKTIRKSELMALPLVGEVVGGLMVKFLTDKGIAVV